MLNKIEAVKEVFSAIDADTARFKLRTGLRCPDGCGECCKKENIYATVLEFLPLAAHLHQAGLVDHWLGVLDRAGAVCVFHEPHGKGETPGCCGCYEHRGAICRLFGFTSVLCKDSRKSLATCRIIKETFPELYARAELLVRSEEDIPVLRNYYFMLCGVDMGLANKSHPINEAIRRAVQMVDFHFSYLRVV